jgi:RNA polymerase sigma factor for flagellar operon FliA
MEDAAEFWTKYKTHDDRAARKGLIIHYTQLVRYVVGRLALGLPPSLQHDDLIGYGILGLIEAIDRFDPNQGVQFATYAVSRIRGQIIDSLRSLDLLPRSVYRHNREIKEAISHLTLDLGRSPNDEEIAKKLNITTTQLRQRLRDTNFAMISLDRTITFDNGEESNLYSSLEDPRAVSPAEQLDDAELKQELVRALGQLPERERIIISLYYNDGLTMKEIGQALDVSESRVSQVHAQTMLTLRSLIQNATEPNSKQPHRRDTHAAIFATVS